MLRIAVLAFPVFVGVEAFLLWCVFRYRKRDDLPAPQGAGSGKILGIFFAIPTVIVAVLFPFGEQTLSYVQHRDKNPDVVINVDGRGGVLELRGRPRGWSSTSPSTS